MRRIFAQFLMLSALFGCTDSGPIKTGPDSYTISIRVPFGGPASASGNALKEANVFCESNGKEILVDHVQSSECALHGGCGEAQIFFYCLASGDPQLQRPKFRRAPNSSNAPASGTAASPQPKSSPPISSEGSSGTGYAVDDLGSVVTNQHVIARCTKFSLRRSGETVAAALVASDQNNDLAVVRGNLPDLRPAHFRDGKGIRPADTVVAMGYPYAGLLATAPQVTTGTVTALAGIGDDTRLLQITAAVQPGNSGGPLFDLSGNVVGTVVSTLDSLVVAKATGSIPQNVNFAIKAGVVRDFLDAKGVAYLSANSTAKMEPADVGQAGAKSVVMVECSR
jgi:S1-C subfamily serine protease